MYSRFNRSRNVAGRIVAVALLGLLALNLAAPVWACGPSFVVPIFVFDSSPDLPFSEFTSGKIGIVKPTFGRKTLTIAFRYLNRARCWMRLSPGHSGTLPLSAQNQFLEQRMRLGKTLADFLQFSGRRPVSFYEEGRYGSIRDFVDGAKSNWIPEYNKETKEEFDRNIEKYYESMLLWDSQSNFDDVTIDILNWHFPLSVMAEASRHPALPDHLRRRFALATWTRAIVLKQPAVAEKIAPELMKLAPALTSVVQEYLEPRRRTSETMPPCLCC